MQPGDDYLARSIAAAFDSSPEPATARLEALERRLAARISDVNRSRRPRARFWWFMAVLFATGAAAWWGGEYWSGTVSPESHRQLSGVAEKTPHHGARGAEQVNEDKAHVDAAPDSESKAPTIYRREVY